MFTPPTINFIIFHLLKEYKKCNVNYRMQKHYKLYAEHVGRNTRRTYAFRGQKPTKIKTFWRWSVVTLFFSLLINTLLWNRVAKAKRMHNIIGNKSANTPKISVDEYAILCLCLSQLTISRMTPTAKNITGRQTIKNPIIFNVSIRKPPL
mgnify:CR=1 FL=1